MDLKLLLSVQHERVVRKDSTVLIDGVVLQLPKTNQRAHYVRCPVLVHEMLNDTLVVTYQGRRIARFNKEGTLLTTTSTRRKAA